MSNETDSLKPCIMCGHEYTLKETGPYGAYFTIHCGKCFISMTHKDEVTAEKLWNTRAELKPDEQTKRRQEIIEEYEKIITGLNEKIKRHDYLMLEPDTRRQDVCGLAEKVFIHMHGNFDMDYLIRRNELDSCFRNAEEFIKARNAYLGEKL